MDATPNNDTKRSKPRKTPAHLRKPQILALQAAGMTQTEIAAKLGVGRTAIVKDLQELRPAREALKSQLADLVGEIDKVITVKDRAKKYADHAKSAKNEAVSMMALQRIDDLAGIVTQKELVRTRRDEPNAPQAMFMLPPGAMVSVSVSAGPAPINVTPTATGSAEVPDNGASGDDPS